MTEEEKQAQIMHFVPMESVKSAADAEFEKQKVFLHKLIPSGDIQHVGSTAVPGSLTKGDLDINVRVPAEDFVDTRTKLSKYFHPNYPDEIWTEGFASFEQDDNPTIPFGVQLTIIGDKYDEFIKIRDLLISRPELLERYNSIKLRSEGKTWEDYRKEKRALFGRNGSNPLLSE